MILSRGVGAVLKTALAQPVVCPVVLVALDWPTGWLRFHTSYGAITWGGFTWTGTGPFDELSIGEEGEGLASADASIRLLGDLGACLADAEAVIKNRPALVYSGLVTANAGNVLIGEPFVQFSGTMDGLIYRQDGASHGLSLTLTAGPGARVGAAITHSNEDQAAKYPTDTAGRHTQLAAANARVRTWPE
jgi:hypothetical protein